jgi:hypothetical protein
MNAGFGTRALSVNALRSNDGPAIPHYACAKLAGLTATRSRLTGA